MESWERELLFFFQTTLMNYYISEAQAPKRAETIHSQVPTQDVSGDISRKLIALPCSALYFKAFNSLLTIAGMLMPCAGALSHC